MPRRTLASYLPVPHRLKKPSLVQRWERLAPYARAVPDRPHSVVYTNVLADGWGLTGHRDKINSSMVFLTRASHEDIDALDGLGPGEDVHVLNTEYKINTEVPFLIRHITSTHLRATGGDGLDLASKNQLGVRGTFRLLRMAATTGALTPSEDEIDEILDYLDNATPVRLDNTFRS